jgi:two-component sensor histidine kinase
VNALLKDSQQRIRSMALIHEQLYRSHDLGRIDFAAYVRELAAHVARSYQVNTDGITLAMTLEDMWLNLDTAIPCGLILQELLSNCFKHAFPGGRAGEIRITLHTDSQGMYRLSVSDTGVGLPEGLTPRDAKSLGLQLVCILTEQLDGTIALDGNPGATFTLTFAEAIRSVRS